MTETLEHQDGVGREAEDQPAPAEPEAVNVESEAATIRELVYKAHPDVVQELLIGQTLTDILESVEPARAAYQRIAERVERNLLREQAASATQPAGAPGTPALDQAVLTTTERLRLGLRERSGTPA